jgi:predicted MFS family arabinose efflux permease
MRTYLKQRLVDDALLAAAYSLESVLIESVFIVGPVFVSLFIAFDSPAMAVYFAAGCGFAGTLLFLRSPALRGWRIEPRTSAGFLGPLAQPGFLPLIGVILCYSIAFGLLEIGITAYATELGRPALAGVFLGLMSAGSAFGGLAYGSRNWGLPLARQFAMMLGLMAVGLGVLAFNWHPWLFAALCVLAGLVMAPALIIQSMLVAKTARPEHSTEAFTWSSSALLAGVGIGFALGGVLLEVARSPAALAAGAASALLAALGSLVALRR